MEVFWSEPAEEDLLRIFEFNLSRSVDWATRVDARLFAGGEGLSRSPHMGKPLPGTGSRLLLLVDIQYIISYRVEGELVTITGVQSSRENRGIR